MKIEQITTNYQTALRAFLLSRVGNTADADDLLQEVLTKTYQKLHMLKASDKVKPWLFQIANNAIIDHYRRAKRDRNVVVDDLWYSENDDETAHAFEGCIEPFLAALPKDTGDLLRAIELEGMSQKDYAAQSGVSYSTLKSRVQAARTQLRRLFDDCCDITLSADGAVVDYQRKKNSRNGC